MGDLRIPNTEGA